MKKQYCRYCGTQVRQEKKFGAFNEETGEQYTWFVPVCPKKRWYQFWHNEVYRFSH